MCEWQPDVKRKETGLRSGTDQNRTRMRTTAAIPDEGWFALMAAKA